MHAKLSDWMEDFFNKNQGLVRFDAFMQEALYNPMHGYYSQAQRIFGRSGDFVTAPEISPLFAQTLASAIREPLKACAGHVWEFGAGRGRLAADLIKHLGDSLSCYHIVDVSGGLQAEQAIYLQAQGIDVATRVRWETTLPDTLKGVVIGNEVLDAMPVRLWRRLEQQCFERYVEERNGELHFSDQPADEALTARVNELHSRNGPWPQDYRSESGEQAEAFIATITERLEGLALMIDYGFGESEFFHPQRCTGTLVAHHRHQMSEELLERIGEQDLTAHVNFSAVYESLFASGGELLGYTSQAAFLLHHGLLDHAGQTAVTNMAEVQEKHALQMLVSPAEMGELFKVMVWCRKVQPDHWTLTKTLANIDRSRQL
ncbi:MAG: SAM-dependent methyltransferase [Burkholderiales bacterium]|nr:SAM-dependent methyltransferase [Burkholderiales bacterium]